MSDPSVKTKYLILGQGLAGTLLSFRLSKLGIEHIVMDRGHEGASSNVAAGIVNPVTGRRFVKAWRIDLLTPGLRIYKELEQLLGIHLLNEITVYRDLSEISALNQWDMRRSDTAYTPFMGRPQSELEVPIRVPRLVGPTLQAAQVNLRELITSYRSLLLSKKKLVEVEHSVDDAFFSNGYWHIGGFAARKIIDCTGSTAMQTSTWAKLPWRGTKGEALRFSLTEMPRNLAIKMRHFICPIGNTNEVWLGGTNQDHFVDNAPSTDAEAKLAAQAVAFEIALPKQREHLVAIRPTVKDRRPLVGEHPEKPGLWICNGFGTKGTSLGPFCTEQLANALLIGDTLDVEIDIKNRFCTD